MLILIVPVPGRLHIRKTCPCVLYPIYIPLLYSKTGVYLKHILRVLVRTASLNEAVLTCTHNICFEQKYENSQNCHFYSRQKSLYIAWACFRNDLWFLLTVPFCIAFCDQQFLYHLQLKPGVLCLSFSSLCFLFLYDKSTRSDS